MDRKSFFGSVVVVLSIVLFALSISCEKGAPAPPAEDKVLLLITEEEAASPDSKDLMGLKEYENGPKIVIETPQNNSTFRDSLCLHIYIKKRENGPDVNMDSFKVSYLKLVPIDITDRLRKNIKGTELDIASAGFPDAGNYRFEFYVEDMNKNATAKYLSVYRTLE